MRTLIRFAFLFLLLAACSPVASHPLPVVQPDPYPNPPSQAALPTDTSQPTSDDINYTFPQPFKPGGPIALKEIHMVGDDTGWGIARDGSIYNLESKPHLVRTSDGGLTWRDLPLPGGSDSPGGFFALDGETAWVAPESEIRRDVNNVFIPYETLYTYSTANGGQTWRKGQPFSLVRKGMAQVVSEYFVHIQFLDRELGWLLVIVDCQSHMTCGWQLYQTNDAGMNWERISDSEQSDIGGNIYSFVFWDEENGWGAQDSSVIGWTGAHSGWNAKLFKTTDGGQTWNAWQSNGSERFVNGSTGWRLSSSDATDQGPICCKRLMAVLHGLKSIACPGMAAWISSPRMWVGRSPGGLTPQRS